MKLTEAPIYRHRKFTVTIRSVSDVGLDLRAGACSPVELWRPSNSQPVLVKTSRLVSFQHDLVPLQVAQPPSRVNANLFSLEEMPHQSYVPRVTMSLGPQ